MLKNKNKLISNATLYVQRSNQKKSKFYKGANKPLKLIHCGLANSGPVLGSGSPSERERREIQLSGAGNRHTCQA